VSPNRLSEKRVTRFRELKCAYKVKSNKKTAQRRKCGLPVREKNMKKRKNCDGIEAEEHRYNDQVIHFALRLLQEEEPSDATSTEIALRRRIGPVARPVDPRSESIRVLHAAVYAGINADYFRYCKITQKHADWKMVAKVVSKSMQSANIDAFRLEYYFIPSTFVHFEKTGGDPSGDNRGFYMPRASASCAMGPVVGSRPRVFVLARSAASVLVALYPEAAGHQDEKNLLNQQTRVEMVKRLFGATPQDFGTQFQNMASDRVPGVSFQQTKHAQSVRDALAIEEAEHERRVLNLNKKRADHAARRALEKANEEQAVQKKIADKKEERNRRLKLSEFSRFIDVKNTKNEDLELWSSLLLGENAIGVRAVDDYFAFFAQNTSLVFECCRPVHAPVPRTIGGDFVWTMRGERWTEAGYWARSDLVRLMLGPPHVAKQTLRMQLLSGGYNNVFLPGRDTDLSFFPRGAHEWITNNQAVLRCTKLSAREGLTLEKASLELNNISRLAHRGLGPKVFIAVIVPTQEADRRPGLAVVMLLERMKSTVEATVLNHLHTPWTSEVRTVSEYVSSVVQLVADVSSMNLVGMDLKPQNLMEPMDPAEPLKLIDVDPMFTKFLPDASAASVLSCFFFNLATIACWMQLNRLSAVASEFLCTTRPLLRILRSAVARAAIPSQRRSQCVVEATATPSTIAPETPSVQMVSPGVDELVRFVHSEKWSSDGVGADGRHFVKSVKLEFIADARSADQTRESFFLGAKRMLHFYFCESQEEASMRHWEHVVATSDNTPQRHEDARISRELSVSVNYFKVMFTQSESFVSGPGSVPIADVLLGFANQSLECGKIHTRRGVLNVPFSDTNGPDFRSLAVQQASGR